MLGAAKNAEEKSKKAMVDAARLADELRAEQDHASTQASSKQSLNNQFVQLEARLADAENAAARGGKAPWPSWRTRSTSWRPSLLAPRLALERPPRLTSVLSASARSSPSPLARTSRTRRPRRSPPSTWPSSGRPSRSLRRSRSAPSL